LSIEWGRRLAKPAWIVVGDYLSILSAASFLSALISLAGLPRIALAILALLSAFFLIVVFTTLGGTSHLTFGTAGLSIDYGDLRFVVPWNVVERVHGVGPNQYQMTVLQLRDTSSIVPSVEPATLTARRRVENLLKDSTVVLNPWTGGLDGLSTVRLITEASGGEWPPSS